MDKIEELIKYLENKHNIEDKWELLKEAKKQIDKLYNETNTKLTERWMNS